jgi:hypothetical protein
MPPPTKPITQVLADALNFFMPPHWSNVTLGRAPGLAEGTIRNYRKDASTTGTSGKPRKPARVRTEPAVSRLESSVELPGGRGTVHVLNVPTGYMESARCVVVTSPVGSPAVACTPKDLDIPAAE